MSRKGYSDGPFGQIHWRMMEPEDEATQPDLYCLHPGPFSGLAFTGIMPFLAKERRVIAPDYPGYGGSDAFKAAPSINEYSEAMKAVIDDLTGNKPIDLFGFHTGNLVAVEMALQFPIAVRRLALVDVPAFDAETREKHGAESAKDFEITSDINCLEWPWRRGILNRMDSQDLDRCLEMFTEQLRPGRLMNKAFHAAFSYDGDERLPKVSHPTIIIATQSGLLVATRRAGKLMPDAYLIERLDIKRAVLDEAAEKTAGEVLKFLDGDS